MINDRRNLYLGAGLAVLCIIVVYLMVYMVEPRIRVQTQITAPLAKTIEKEGGKKIDPHGPTIDEIKKTPESSGPDLSFGKMRNPFVLEGEMDVKEVDNKPEVPLTPPRLGMIVFGPGDRLAFLDQKLVREGAQHGGFRVERIAPKSVTLSHASGRLQLIAPRDHFGPAEVKRSGKDKL